MHARPRNTRIIQLIIQSSFSIGLPFERKVGGGKSWKHKNKWERKGRGRETRVAVRSKSAFQMQKYFVVCYLLARSAQFSDRNDRHLNPSLMFLCSNSFNFVKHNRTNYPCKSTNIFYLRVTRNIHILIQLGTSKIEIVVLESLIEKNWSPFQKLMLEIIRLLFSFFYNNHG